MDPRRAQAISAHRGALEQIDRYLATLEHERSWENGWTGHMAPCCSASRQLVSESEQRDDVH
jgi:hypothetical protein